MSDQHGPGPRFSAEGQDDAAAMRSRTAHQAGTEATEVDHLVGMAFDKVTRADEVLLALLHLVGEGQIALTDAVVVSKGDNGRVKVRQTVDPGPAQGALTGTIWGMLAGLLFADPFLGALLGAGTGALMGRLIDHGLDDSWVKEVGTWLDPGTSALLLLVGGALGPATLRELSRYEGRVLYCTFPDAVRRELERALASVPPPDLSDPQLGAGGPDAEPGSDPA